MGHAVRVSGARGGTVVIEYRYANHPLGGVRHVGRLEFGRQLALPLVASVLEPDLHLRLRQVERHGESGALGARQVALHVEGRLELEDLTAREHRPRLLLAPAVLRVVQRQLRGAGR